jgi:hypothetical protein
MPSIAKYWKTLSPAQKLLAATGLGGGVALAENKYLGDFLPEELKTINLGIGGTTGALAVLGGRKGMMTALGTLPLKQMALLGVGSMEKARAQRRSLMGLELDRASTDLETAKLGLKGEGLKKLLATLAVGSGMAGAGALGYHVYDNKKYKDWHEQREKEKEERRKNRNITASKGKSRRGVEKLRIKIDVPASAAPEELLRSLTNLDDGPNTKTQYVAKKAFKNVLSY